MLNSGYAVGIRDCLAGPRLERFTRGADEAGYTLLATADRNTLLSVVEEARYKLSLPAADEHALRMTVVMLCANPPFAQCMERSSRSSSTAGAST